MTRYGIRLPDGHLVTDPEWRCLADVMRSGHGQGITRVRGELVRIPERIQRRRTAGWRMPEGAVYVGRPSRWGNPFSVVGGTVVGPHWFDVKGWPLTRGVRLVDDEPLAAYSTHAPAAGAVAASVRLFADLVAVRLRDRSEVAAAWLAPLAGRDLACWCPLSSPCHADVLLELANPTTDALRAPESRQV